MSLTQFNTSLSCKSPPPCNLTRWDGKSRGQLNCCLLLRRPDNQLGGDNPLRCCKSWTGLTWCCGDGGRRGYGPDHCQSGGHCCILRRCTRRGRRRCTCRAGRGSHRAQRLGGRCGRGGGCCCGWWWWWWGDNTGCCRDCIYDRAGSARLAGQHNF